MEESINLFRDRLLVAGIELIKNFRQKRAINIGDKVIDLNNPLFGEVIQTFIKASTSEFGLGIWIASSDKLKGAEEFLPDGKLFEGYTIYLCVQIKLQEISPDQPFYTSTLYINQIKKDTIIGLSGSKLEDFLFSDYFKAINREFPSRYEIEILDPIIENKNAFKDFKPVSVSSLLSNSTIKGINEPGKKIISRNGKLGYSITNSYNFKFNIASINFNFSSRRVNYRIDESEIDRDSNYKSRLIKVDSNDLDKPNKEVERLEGNQESRIASNILEQILNKKVDVPNIEDLPIENQLVPIIENRLEEIQATLDVGANLSVIFLCGSVLEGVLLGAAKKDPERFNKASCTPKNSDGSVKTFRKWHLSEFIDVACEIGILKLDVKIFVHELREFRNYIHPYKQMSSGFSPDKYTAEICLQVLKASLASVAGMR